MGLVHGLVSFGARCVRVVVVRSPARMPAAARRGAFGRDEGVEPADVAGDAVGGVLRPPSGRRRRGRRGPPRPRPAAGPAGPAGARAGQPGLGRQVAGEGQAQPEAPGVVGRPPPSASSSAKSCRPGVGDPVDLAAPPGPGGRVAAGPETASSPLSEPVGGAGCAPARPGGVTLGGHDRAATSRAGSGPGRSSRTRRWPGGPGARAGGAGSRSRGGRRSSRRPRMAISNIAIQYIDSI